MTRRHRTWHFWLWLVLGPLTLLGLGLGVALRPGVVTQSAPRTLVEESLP